MPLGMVKGRSAAAHCVEPGVAAKRAQALVLARITSTPRVLAGEVAGRSSSGSAPRAAEGGKAIWRERATGEARATEALQSRAGAPVVGEAAQAPAVESGAAEELDQQAQAVQARVCRAEGAQQQPPRQELEAQSKGEAQGSPGERVAQEPLPGKHALQPMAVAVALQQKPPLQAPEAQVALEAQGEPELEVEGAETARPRIAHW